MSTEELEVAEAEVLIAMWLLAASIAFAPELDECVRDGGIVQPEGDLPFNLREGGALCPQCAAQVGATQLPERARRALVAFLDPDAAPVRLDGRDVRAHRRLVARFVRFHLGERAALPALDFWGRRPCAAR